MVIATLSRERYDQQNHEKRETRATLLKLVNSDKDLALLSKPHSSPTHYLFLCVKPFALRIA